MKAFEVPQTNYDAYLHEQELIRLNFIMRAEAGLFDLPYPGYPTQRFSIKDMVSENPTLPDGPWSTGEFDLPSPEEQAVLLQKGYALDDFGRPLHPWLNYMLANDRIGTVSGRGAYWKWGPNYTADPVVITREERPRVLLILRGDTKTPALPGGFVDHGENELDACARELEEETGLILPANAGTQFYKGIVADKRTTAHSWAETTAAVWFIDKALPVQGRDDALEANWWPLDALPESFFGSHSILVYAAKQRMS